MNQEKKRIIWVDYVKAFLIFLVVLAHLIDSLQLSKIDTYMDVTEMITYLIRLFCMPLFMCMSGFLYCKTKREFSWESYKKFEIKKFINFFVPYVTFYVLSLGVNMIFSSAVNAPKQMSDILGIFNNPMAPYWFLYALFSIFLFIPLMEKVLKKKNIVFALLLILKILSIFFTTKIYFIDSFMKNAVYFYFGVFINESSNKYNNSVLNILSLIIYIILSIVCYKFLSVDNVYANLVRIPFGIAGILIFVSIFRKIEKSRILDTFKDYTFQIFLTHTFFSAGVRILLLKLNITNFYIHFIIGLLAGVYGPVLMSIISKKIKYTEIFFYPAKTVKELKELKEKSNVNEI